jgi:8-oxo-dGTP diphosphatase
VTVERVVLAVDVVCLALREERLWVLLGQRESEPFAGRWALPGGVLLPRESLDEAAERLLEERTGLRRAGYLEQLYTFGDVDRDPRGRTVSVAYYLVLPRGEYGIRAGRGMLSVAWHPLDQLPELAFDHATIVRYARTRLGQKIDYTPLAFSILPETFTMGDLRAIHEAILGHELHPSNFVRQMMARWDLAPVPGERDRRTRRPARLYRYIGAREISGPPREKL